MLCRRNSLLAFCVSLAVGVVVLTGALSVSAQDAKRKPELQAGKTALFERILTRPEAILQAQPGATGGEQQPSFSRFYVYGRQLQNGEAWLEVGPDSLGNVTGWMKESQTVPWLQQIVLRFTNPQGRAPTLFFKNRQPLEEIMGDFDPKLLVDPIRQSLKANGQDERIVAVEPDNAVSDEKFYLLPILEAEEVLTGVGPKATMLKVASVTKPDPKDDEADAAAEAQTPAPEDFADIGPFNAGIVFVIDSTISMGPYIERTREAVRGVYDQIEAEGLSEETKFGLVAYRSNIDGNKELEYVAREFADPVEVKDGDDFLAKIKTLEPANVSTPKFDEDAYAGVKAALDEIKWTEFAARYIILITDAGALDGDDPLAKTGLGAQEVRLEAQHRGVAIYTLHLKTPEGANNHASAEQQYTELSTHPLVKKPLYYPVEAGSVDKFGNIVDGLARSISSQVKAIYEGDVGALGSAQNADPSYGANESQPEDQPTDDAPASAVPAEEDPIAILGHAFVLEYLGKRSGTKAPTIVEGWIADKALEDIGRSTVEKNLLLTKNQLSDLQLVTKTIVDNAFDTMQDPQLFFKQLSSAAATMGRDPNRIGQGDALTLADTGIIGEYLEGLPYRSKVLNLTLEDWVDFGPSQQEAFVLALERKLKLYESYNADTDRWESLAKGSDAQDHVYPVPLDALP